ncbi:MAG: hypothetical protein IJR48_03920 [Oscillibacter sp.]|nr:hypothetical protein [Oscillibacter sp.]
MNEPQAIPVPDTVPQNENPGVAVDANPAPQGVTIDAPQGVANPAPQGDAPDYRALYETLRRENEILRHNAEIAQRAPVQGVSGGGAGAAPVDDFTRGFDSDTWGD